MGTWFINIGAICFGTELAISMCKEIYQYIHFMYNYKVTLKIYEISPKYEKIVHWMGICQNNIFLVF